jgi:hypothetical protein
MEIVGTLALLGSIVDMFLQLVFFSSSFFCSSLSNSDRSPVSNLLRRCGVACVRPFCLLPSLDSCDFTGLCFSLPLPPPPLCLGCTPLVGHHSSDIFLISPTCAQISSLILTQRQSFFFFSCVSQTPTSCSVLSGPCFFYLGLCLNGWIHA